MYSIRITNVKDPEQLKENIETLMSHSSEIGYLNLKSSRNDYGERGDLYYESNEFPAPLIKLLLKLQTYQCLGENADLGFEIGNERHAFVSTKNDVYVPVLRRGYPTGEEAVQALNDHLGQWAVISEPIIIPTHVPNEDFNYMKFPTNEEIAKPAEKYIPEERTYSTTYLENPSQTKTFNNNAKGNSAERLGAIQLYLNRRMLSMLIGIQPGNELIKCLRTFGKEINSDSYFLINPSEIVGIVPCKSSEGYRDVLCANVLLKTGQQIQIDTKSLVEGMLGKSIDKEVSEFINDFVYPDILEEPQFGRSVDPEAYDIVWKEILEINENWKDYCRLKWGWANEDDEALETNVSDDSEEENNWDDDEFDINKARREAGYTTEKEYESPYARLLREEREKNNQPLP